MPECSTCKSYLTADYIRVFGDNDGEIDSCPNCSSTERRERARRTTDTSDRTVYLHDVMDESTDTSKETSEPETEHTSAKNTGLRARIGEVSGLLGR